MFQNLAEEMEYEAMMSRRAYKAQLKDRTAIAAEVEFARVNGQAEVEEKEEAK